MERKPLNDADLAQWTVRRPGDPACAAGDGRARKASVTGTGRKSDSGRADHGGDQVRRKHPWSSMRHVVTQQPQIACWNALQARQMVPSVIAPLNWIERRDGGPRSGRFQNPERDDASGQETAAARGCWEGSATA